eukprot:CAMPEP_0170648040 /NCGR_PEP_ID=MMETSP0224-20130122/44520_1 /TAXON_ID=285029 /ORGANISM="Togula jolla, Strain CCCM 725" /LENGTH=44 /DNA_ID= /DNA_START= /DNA_END= /DNA_ORIENTATION=
MPSAAIPLHVLLFEMDALHGDWKRIPASLPVTSLATLLAGLNGV